MRKINLYAAAAGLILAGVVAWTSSIVQAPSTQAAVPASAQVDPFQSMATANALPATHFVDYSLIFN